MIKLTVAFRNFANELTNQTVNVVQVSRRSFEVADLGVCAAERAA
jgi:hypothetical protein